MMYMYASMLLHKAGKEITEENIKKVLEAAGVKVDDARAKALVAALEGVSIEEAIEKAAMPVAVAAAPVAEAKAAPKVDEKKKAEEEKKAEDAAAAGLGSLFG